MNKYNIEITDTFGGESNYSWVKRFTVESNTMLGAIHKLGALYCTGWRLSYGDSELSCYKLPGACVICFISIAE